MRSCAFFIAVFLAGFLAQGQDPSEGVTRDSTRQITPTRYSSFDSLSTQPVDSIPPQPRTSNDISTTINYNARDSMFFDLTNQSLRLYGNTHVDYGQIVLEAERTQVDWVNQTIKSEFVLDSAGKKIGKPIFNDRGKIYETDDIIYDFKSRKAVIQGVITEQDGAIMHGRNVKKNEANDMFISGALYTTCNLAHPHFFIESKKLKVIPGNKVITGPFHLKFREVPTPLWGPFGMFPQPKKKASGIIMPTYGEEVRRGFFLRGGGYYFDISDYVDLRVTGDLYSKGGHALNFSSNYIKRYAYRGSMSFEYTKNVTGTLINTSEQNSYWYRWNHSPQSRGNSRFSASVSLGSTSFNENNNLLLQDFERSITAQYSSNVTYSNKLQGTPYNLNSSARFSQNIQTGIVNLTLPDITMNMTRLFPFKGLAKSNKSPLAKLSFSHTFAAKNELTNAPRSGYSFDVANEFDDSQDTLAFNGQNLSRIYDRSRLGARHTVPITTSMNVLKYFTFSPTFNYQEVWYGRELKFTDYDALAGGVRVDTVETFSRAGSWRSSASLNTRLYGLYPVGKLGIQAIRHVITPNISFSYNPDFSDTKYGVYKDVVIDEDGNTRRLSKYEGFIYGSPPGGESQTMSFSLTNNIEMKVLDKSDSTGESFKKVKLFDNLAASGGYNFAADSFKLNDFSLSARTSLFKGKLTINTNATLDPYMYKLISKENGRVQQRKLDRYTWNNGKGLGQFKSVRASINFNLDGKKKGQGSQGSDRNSQFDPSFSDPNFNGEPEEVQEIIRHIQDNPEQYVDFDLPWSVRTAFTVSRRKTGFEDAITTRSMTLSGSLGLTDKTQITFNSGYDFESKEFTTTRISLSRDLHCWTLDFNWVPFGTYQSYMLVIRAKSSILQDLKVQKRKSFFDAF